MRCAMRAAGRNDSSSAVAGGPHSLDKAQRGAGNTVTLVNSFINEKAAPEIASRLEARASSMGGGLRSLRAELPLFAQVRSPERNNAGSSTPRRTTGSNAPHRRGHVKGAAQECEFTATARGDGLKGMDTPAMEYSSLREQPTGKLRDVNSSIEALLSHSELLPTELRIKLDTLHADITAILEDRQDWDGADSPRGAHDPEK